MSDESNMREFICIGCPFGCQLTAEINNDEIKISGNLCKIGIEYGKNEVKDPRRTVTSSVLVTNGVSNLVSVKTKGEIPKNKIFDCLNEIKKIKVNAPVHIGDILLKNISGTGIDIVATKSVLESSD